jgi:hypothetical protein
VPYLWTNGIWYSDFRAQDPKTGRPRRFRLSLGPEVRSEKEAEKAERRMQVRIENEAAVAQATRSAPPSPSPLAASRPGDGLPSAPFSGLAARWLEVAVWPKLKPKTATLYESCCRVWLVPYFGDREASTIGPAEVEGLQAYMTRTPRAKGSDLPPGPKTNNEVIGCLSSMLGTAVRWRYLRSNPCDLVQRMKVPEGDLEYYDAPQAARWLLACRETEARWYSLFLAGFLTGLREGELFALRVEDLGDMKRVHVRRTYGAASAPGPDGRVVPVYVEGTPKSHRTRYVGISPMLAAALRAHIGTRKTGLVWSVPPREDGDAHVRLSNILYPWDAVTEASKLPRYSLHAMRHSFASQLVMAGVQLEKVQQLMGHSTRKMTERYAHLSPGWSSSATDVLDIALDIGTASDPKNQGGRPLNVVGVTGFEPVVDLFDLPPLKAKKRA